MMKTVIVFPLIFSTVRRLCIDTYFNQYECVWFGLVSLFNSISAFLGYLMPKLSNAETIPLEEQVVLSNP